jgi:hypothetical protein
MAANLSKEPTNLESVREVYATTVVVILVSAAIGLYLFAVDQVLLNSVAWIFRKFGAGA